jgi:hypothetical protein
VDGRRLRENSGGAARWANGCEPSGPVSMTDGREISTKKQEWRRKSAYSNAKTKMLLLLLALISGVSRFNPVLTRELPTLTATYCLPFAE